MKSFFSEYGGISIAAIVVTLLLVLASPVGASVKNSVTGLITKFTGTSESLANTMSDTVITLNDDLADAETTSQAQLISFTLDDVTYQAEEGMTWGEWHDSSYCKISPKPTFSFLEVHSGTFVEETTLSGIKNYKEIRNDEVIINGKNYLHERNWNHVLTMQYSDQEVIDVYSTIKPINLDSSVIFIDSDLLYSGVIDYGSEFRDMCSEAEDTLYDDKNDEITFRYDESPMPYGVFYMFALGNADGISVSFEIVDDYYNAGEAIWAIYYDGSEWHDVEDERFINNGDGTYTIIDAQTGIYAPLYDLERF